MLKTINHATLTDFISIADLDGATLRGLLDTATAMKADPRAFANELVGKSAILLFEKPSLRTRVAFEVGLGKLGMQAMYYDHGVQRIGARESIKDYAKNLERWVDCIIARTFDHETILELAEHASVPVVNALSEAEHPCQALADFMTIKEHLGTLDNAKVAYIGDGNNVCHSLILAAARLGVSLTIVTPRGFEPQFSVVREALAVASITGAQITITHDIEAVVGHDVVYTDTWISMGHDAEAERRLGNFAGFQVDDDIMALASKGLDRSAIFMHCLPAHRGEEVTDEVMDASYSVIYDQAENRLHTQNAVMHHLFLEHLQ